MGVVDPDGCTAEPFADAAGVPWLASFEDLMSAVALDAVVVCTPPEGHADAAITAARAGVHALCERPLAVDRAGAWAMCQAARASGTVLAMSTKFRYAADVERACNLLRLGVLGDIIVVATEFSMVVDQSRRAGTGGVLLDYGADALDIVRYLLGPLDSLSAAEGSRPQALGVEETVQLFVRSADGSYATIGLSWSAPPTSPYYVQIAGTRGRISLGWQESLYRGEGDESWKAFGNGYDAVSALAGQVDDFVGTVRTGVPGRAALDDGLASVAAIEAAYASLARERWVTIASQPVGGPPEVRGAGAVAFA